MGHGLSYSTFVYSGLKMDKTSVKQGETITISFNVKNTGAFDGDEVVQLYVRNLDSKEEQPLKSLRGFKRVHIARNKDTNIGLSLKIEDLKYFNVKKNDFVVDPGRYEILIGSSSEDFKLKGIINVN